MRYHDVAVVCRGGARYEVVLPRHTHLLALNRNNGQEHIAHEITLVLVPRENVLHMDTYVAQISKLPPLVMSGGAA